MLNVNNKLFFARILLDSFKAILFCSYVCLRKNQILIGIKFLIPFYAKLLAGSLVEFMLIYRCFSIQDVTCWPMLLSTFSHHSALHLAANMYVLHSFSGLAVATLGKEQFVAFYLTSGVVSSLTSYLYKTMFGLPGLSLGAVNIIPNIFFNPLDPNVLNLKLLFVFL